MPTPRLLFVVCSMVVFAGGCQPTLETGYEPRPLKSSEADRRSYYAPAFTPESHPEKEAGSTGFNLQP